MPRVRPLRYSVAILVSSLLLNVLFVSCAADQATGPRSEVNEEVLAKLDAVLARLTTIEAALAEQTDTLTDRLDTLTARVGTGGSTPGGAGGLDSARVDSILNLASFIAEDMTTAGWEICGGAALSLAGGAVTKGEAVGEGQGSLGAWAGTGGFAGAKVELKREYALEAALEGGVGLEVCAPISRDEPPIRREASARVVTTSANLETSLTGIATQLGLDESRVMGALNTIATGVQSPGSLRIQDAASLLPLPAGMSAVLSDPVGALTSEVPAKVDEAISLLCNSNWGSRVSAPINTACSRISANSVDIGGLFDMVDQFPALQSSLTTVSNRTGAICTRINSIGTASLSIPNPLSIGPDPFYGPRRLFPSYTGVSC